MANLKLYSVDLSIMDKSFVLSQTRFKYHPETHSFTHVGRWYGIDGLTIDDWKKILKQLCDYLRKRQEHANKGTQFIAMYVISQYHKGTLDAPLQRVPLHCHMLIASKKARTVAQWVQEYWTHDKRYAKRISFKMCHDEGKLLYILEQCDTYPHICISKHLKASELSQFYLDSDYTNRFDITKRLSYQAVVQAFLDIGLAYKNQSATKKWKRRWWCKRNLCAS